MEKKEGRGGFRDTANYGKRERERERKNFAHHISLFPVLPVNDSYCLAFIHWLMGTSGTFVLGKWGLFLNGVSTFSY
jgi:hypothetical protein